MEKANKSNKNWFCLIIFEIIKNFDGLEYGFGVLFKMCCIPY